MSVKWVEVVERSWRNSLTFHLLPSESWMFVKENTDRKKLTSELFSQFLEDLLFELTTGYLYALFYYAHLLPLITFFLTFFISCKKYDHLSMLCWPNLLKIKRLISLVVNMMACWKCFRRRQVSWCCLQRRCRQ